MRSAIVISKIAVRESLRDRIFIGLLLFLGLFLLFSIYVSTLSLGTVARFIQNTGMLGMSVICLAVTVLFGLFSMYREKDRNELYTVLNRVPRHSYLLGRLLGTVYVIAAFALLTGIGIFLLAWLFGDKAAPEIFWAVYWAIIEFSVLSALGVLFFAMGVGFTLNALLVLCLYVIGHSMNEAIQSFVALGRFGSQAHLKLVEFLSYVFPNFDMFDFRLAIVHGEAIPAGHIVISTAYGLFYIAALVAAAAVVMNRSDI